MGKDRWSWENGDYNIQAIDREGGVEIVVGFFMEGREILLPLDVANDLGEWLRGHHGKA